MFVIAAILYVIAEIAISEMEQRIRGKQHTEDNINAIVAVILIT